MITSQSCNPISTATTILHSGQLHVWYNVLLVEDCIIYESQQTLWKEHSQQSPSSLQSNLDTCPDFIWLSGLLQVLFLTIYVCVDEPLLIVTGSQYCMRYSGFAEKCIIHIAIRTTESIHNLSFLCLSLIMKPIWTSL